MKSLSLSLAALVILGSAHASEVPVVIQKPPALPLALSDDFEFRKIQVYRLGSGGLEEITEGRSEAARLNEMLRAEENYRNFGAITRLDRRQRQGEYFTAFWRANRPATITVRLEYRQEKLGPYIQAQERTYENTRGNHKSTFEVIGDAHDWEGAITSWRLVLIENGQIVGLASSALWQ